MDEFQLALFKEMVANISTVSDEEAIKTVTMLINTYNSDKEMPDKLYLELRSKIAAGTKVACLQDRHKWHRVFRLMHSGKWVFPYKKYYG